MLTNQSPDMAQSDLDKNVIICSEDDFFEKMARLSSRHPFKCDKSRQLSPSKERFSYNQFSKYIQTKFFQERLSRRQKLLENRAVPVPLEYYTDDVLKQELFDIYGQMDILSDKYKRIFENYKEERLEQICDWIKEEEALLLESDESESEIQCIEIPSIQNLFSVEEIVSFDKVSIYNLVGDDVFLLPREIQTEQRILEDFGMRSKELKSLTEYDPEINMDKFILPEISDIKVGDRLVERIVDIIKRHPTGVANNAFLSEFKKEHKYFPDHRQMDYSSFAEMINDLGKHAIFIQDMPRYDSFYYPMCLQGLVCSPNKMFFNIWHKIKIMLTLRQGIEKISKLIKRIQSLFGWGPLDIRGWGFEREDIFVQFLIDRFGDRDVEIISGSVFNPKATSKYLVSMTDKQRKHFRKYVSEIEASQEKFSFWSTSLELPEEQPQTSQDFNSKESTTVGASNLNQPQGKGQADESDKRKAKNRRYIPPPSKPQGWNSLFKK